MFGRKNDKLFPVFENTEESDEKGDNFVFSSVRSTLFTPFTEPLLLAVNSVKTKKEFDRLAAEACHKLLMPNAQMIANKMHGKIRLRRLIAAENLILFIYL